jgi:hypothetical protein
MNKETYVTKLLIELSKKANFTFTKKDALAWITANSSVIATDIKNHLVTNDQVPYPTPECLTRFRTAEQATNHGYSGSILGQGLLWQQYGMFLHLVCYITQGILIEYLEQSKKTSLRLNALNIKVGIKTKGDKNCLVILENC